MASGEDVETDEYWRLSNTYPIEMLPEQISYCMITERENISDYNRENRGKRDRLKEQYAMSVIPILKVDIRSGSKTDNTQITLVELCLC